MNKKYITFGFVNLNHYNMGLVGGLAPSFPKQMQLSMEIESVRTFHWINS